MLVPLFNFYRVILSLKEFYKKTMINAMNK